MPLTAPDPVERSRHFDALRAMYDACAGGSGRLVLLGGPVGTGKTEVLRAFIASVRDQGGEVLVAGGSESERNLPLGVLEQLLARPGLPADVVARSAALIDGQQPPWRTYLSRQSDPAGTVLDDLCDSLLQLATPLPLVVAVDDAHLADQPSLRCLHRLAQRLPTAAILIVLVESTTPTTPGADGPAAALPGTAPAPPGTAPAPPGTAPATPGTAGRAYATGGGGGPADDPAGAGPLGAPLPDGVEVCRLEVEPLTLAGVGELLRRREGDRATDAAAFHHAVTGGNLVLLHAVLEDRRAVGAAPDDVVIGDNFAEAVTSCLFRCDPVTLQVARAVAVLREPARPAEIARLVELDEAVVDRALELLTGGGLLDGGRFRHPIGRSAALGSMAQWERAALLQRVGQLHAGGETAEAAEQLVEAGRRSGDWMPTVLREAAERSLADGDLDRARSLLRAAATIKMDEGQRAGIAAALANLRWRTNPGEVLQHVPELLAEVRAGRLTGRAAVTTLLYLLWHGQLDEAVDILPQVVSAAADDPDAQRLLAPALSSLAFTYPGSARRLPDPVGGATTDPLAAARAVLRDCAPDGDTFGLTFAALYVSSFAAGDDGWQDPWEPAVPGSDLPVWQGLTEAVRAEEALRRGDLAAATEHARRGLTELGLDGWGVAVGWPISVLVCAASEAGDYTAAAGYLSMPVPAGMFSTPFGLRYLMARGRYHFGTDRVHAALNDFYAGSETAAAWQLDLPELLPWRTELARAYIKLDRVRPGQDLVRQQLAGLADGQTRLRGAALRVLAATLDPQARVPVLKDAVDLLQIAGDRLETARALADLGAAYQRTGRAELARTTLRAAEQQARLCGALPDAPKTRPQPAEPAAEADHPDAAQLTDAERRVAALAVKGYTNREIAQRLFLTVSTVEQHLTRVYRKLHVVRRRELPAWLRVGVFDDPD
ncbi:AAA family ATPase [Dactylosporangium sp. NPDC049525]|uniref:helix-turn-helix transcriptional regulator n=1 Tax=Dactylosporangium sp. NPDC049525 TaxID=3154730 RepID=UPI00343A29E8